jgi:magnesium transporter
MAKLIRQGKPKAGLPPGSVVYVGDKAKAPTRITLFDYEPDSYVETVIAEIEECEALRGRKSNTWINVDGLRDTDLIIKLDSLFGVHPLVLEDIVNTNQRPKMEDYGDYIYVVLKMLYFDTDKSPQMISEQLSLVIGSNYILSFQEEYGDYFDNIRERLRKDKGRLRKMGSDYLAYTLLDTIIDNYFIVLEKFEEDITRIEERLMKGQRVEASEIHQLMRWLVYLRKQVSPVRELVGSLHRTDSPLIRKSTKIYFRDLYDHTVHVIDTIESFRDILAGVHDIHLSSINIKTTEVMKVLTMISTVFMPLTFIVGVYGMNFDHMPELRWEYGYFAVWFVIIVIAWCMRIYFKKKKWI